ncbi:disease resistance protein PIK6-NP [Aegilops tauschii subsp. strangulata]|uniref:disease resistance protein PIK6-NP n=1 Tax=Aegilops tauschii subsp. strangulata TaxID=200361 RepID=UPI00098BA313|nr:probable disease resistance protein RXW24L [Aegilops tauschii subsp. strangulata]
MAEAVLGPLVGRLQELVMSEARAMVAVNEDVRSLRDKLMWMQAFLRDAEPRRRANNDELIRVCLQQTRDVVFDTEDAVDQYFFRIDLSRYPSWSHTIVRVFRDFFTQVRVRSDLSKRIKLINTRFESIIDNKGKYKIDDGSETMPVTTWRPSTAISATAEKL